MARHLFRSLLILFLIFPSAGARDAVTDGALAPDFTAEDARGKSLTRSQLRGRIVILNFWATWCPACHEGLAILDRVQQRHQRSGVIVVAAATDQQGWSKVTPFLAGRKLTYPVVLATPHLCRLYDVASALPKTFFLNRKGRIIASVDYVLDEETLERVLQLVKNEQQP